MPAVAADNPAKVFAPPRISFFSRWQNYIKLLYAFIAGSFCVWLAAFMPTEGPSIWNYVPTQAALVLQIYDGRAFVDGLQQNRLTGELLKDEDVNALLHPGERRDEVLAEYAKLPDILKSLVPPTPNGVAPFVGNEVSLVLPGVDLSSQKASAPVLKEHSAISDLPAPEEAVSIPAAPPPEKRKNPMLIFTRVSGARGQLARIAARFVKTSKRAQIFDLGGGLLAIGLDGAKPDFAPKSFAHATPAESRSPFASLHLSPQYFEKPALNEALADTIQFEILRGYELPDSMLLALLKPPSFGEVLGIDAHFGDIRIDFFASKDSGISATGYWAASLPKPAINGSETPDKVYAEALLPFDARAAFLRFVIAQDMRIRKNYKQLSKGQKRWSSGIASLEEKELDLDRDLWPALGNVLHLAIQDPPENLNPAGYGLITGEVTANAKEKTVFDAAGELARIKWDYLFDGIPERKVKPPWVKRFRQPLLDRYVLNTGQITAPTWMLSEKLFSFASDAGPFALLDNAPAPKTEPRLPKPGDRYFVRLDGQKLAKTAETLATVYYDSLEDELGSSEFLAQVPDAPLRIHLVRKLSLLLGQFSLEVKPGENSAAIQLKWTPGTLAVPDAPKEEDVIPPPPPAQ